MSNGISEDTFQFLRELKENNNREWFQDNKPRFLIIKQGFEHFMETVHEALNKVEALPTFNPKKSSFRIYRDVRFSKDKSPYKTNIGGIIHRGVEWAQCPWYIHIEPNNVFCGGGIWEPPTDVLKAIRQEIDYNPNPLKEILNSKSFVQNFGSMRGDQLKKAPKGYEVTHENIELLRFKQFLVLKKHEDQVAMGNFAAENARLFEQALPFFNYFDVVIKETGQKV